MTASAASSAVSWPADGRTVVLDLDGVALQLHIVGSGPAILLLHGTGTAGFSFAPLAHLLAPHRTCLIPDLPGHAASALPSDLDRLGISGMAAVIAAALVRLGVTPSSVVGHSAGFVVGVQLALDGVVPVPSLVGLGSALWLSSNPRRSPLWPAIAALSRTRWLASLLSRTVASPSGVARVLSAAGSSLPPEQLAAYIGLASNPSHLHGMLAMMAAWDLVPVQQAAARVASPVLLLGGERDPWFPPANIARQASLFPRGRSVILPGLGHFLHEERPDLIAPHLLDPGD